MSDMGKDLVKGMKNAVAHIDGRRPARRITTVMVKVPDKIDVAAIRRKLGLTQAEFAARFGFSVKNVRNWEQGQRQPEGPARAYLKVIDRNPKAVEKALAA
jgi:putative transcriptional regulator